MIPLLVTKRAQLETLHEEEWKDLKLPPWTLEIESQLRSMSASSIYRYLRKELQKSRFKGISHTHPGSLLKQNIEIKTLAMWDKGLPGYTQMDLIGESAQVILTGQKVNPDKLMKQGYRFAFPRLEEAMKEILETK